MFMNTYKYALQPMNGPHEWKKCGLEPILSPIARRTPGRPKKNRRKSKDEPSKRKDKLSRTGVIMTCSICGQDGHNMRGCPERQSSQKSEVTNMVGSYTAATSNVAFPKATSTKDASASAKVM
ncbi:hypothetical protein PTKIN_Ptkin10aG0142300 [Pterospermum kingtungense]